MKQGVWMMTDEGKRKRRGFGQSAMEGDWAKGFLEAFGMEEWFQD